MEGANLTPPLPPPPPTPPLLPLVKNNPSTQRDIPSTPSTQTHPQTTPAQSLEAMATRQCPSPCPLLLPSTSLYYLVAMAVMEDSRAVNRAQDPIPIPTRLVLAQLSFIPPLQVITTTMDSWARRQGQSLPALNTASHITLPRSSSTLTPTQSQLPQPHTLPCVVVTTTEARPKQLRTCTLNHSRTQLPPRF